jgi:hypothetical protein
MAERYTCPCCGYLVFEEPPGSYDICSICYWEDDLSQLRFQRTTGANQVSLLEAQRNYARDGVCELRSLSSVRAATASDVRDPDWRQFDVDADTIEDPIPGKDYGDSYPEDMTQLYYWRHNSDSS